MQFILIPHYILHCRQCPGSVIIQLFRNKTPVAASSYGTKIGRHIFSACRINYSFVQRSNAAFKLCRRALAHSAAKPRCTSSSKTPFPIWRIAEKQSQLFCHDRPIIFFIALCDPAVTLSVAYRQYIQRRNLPCPTGTAALAVADFYNIDINVLESPCTSIIIVLFGAAHIYVNRDRSCHHTLACICRYSIAVADVVVLTDNVQL